MSWYRSIYTDVYFSTLALEITPDYLQPDEQESLQSTIVSQVNLDYFSKPPMFSFRKYEYEISSLTPNLLTDLS